MADMQYVVCIVCLSFAGLIISFKINILCKICMALDCMHLHNGVRLFNKFNKTTILQNVIEIAFLNKRDGMVFKICQPHTPHHAWN